MSPGKSEPVVPTAVISTPEKRRYVVQGCWLEIVEALQTASRELAGGLRRFEGVPGEGRFYQEVLLLFHVEQFGIGGRKWEVFHVEQKT